MMEYEEKYEAMEEETAERETLFDAEETAGEMDMVIRFRKPYHFERKKYTEIDLSGLDDLLASDMIAANRYIKRTYGNEYDPLQEVTPEYACFLAARATNLPIEFFTGLPIREAIKVKNRVTGFLFGQG